MEPVTAVVVVAAAVTATAARAGGEGWERWACDWTWVWVCVGKFRLIAFCAMIAVELPGEVCEDWPAGTPIVRALSPLPGRARLNPLPPGVARSVIGTTGVELALLALNSCSNVASVLMGNGLSGNRVVLIPQSVCDLGGHCRRGCTRYRKHQPVAAMPRLA